IFGRAQSLALAIFGCATLAQMLLLQLRIYLPSGEPLIQLSPAQVRDFIPKPLPYPEMTPMFFITVGFSVLAPILLGWVVGKQIPVRAASAVYWGFSPFIFGSFLMGCVFLPNTEGLLFAIWQLVFWLPVGCLMAHLSSKVARRSRAKTD